MDRGQSQTIDGISLVDFADEIQQSLLLQTRALSKKWQEEYDTRVEAEEKVLRLQATLESARQKMAVMRNKQGTPEKSSSR